MNKLSNQRRIRLLTTASATVAAAALAGAAQAGTTTVVAPNGAPDVVDAQEIINEAAVNDGSILPALNGFAVGIDGVAGPDASLVVDENDSLSQAFGNNYDNSLLSLSTIENDANGDGAASLVSAVNTGDIQSTIDNGAVGVEVTEFSTGTVAVTENTIATEATANAGTTLLSGSLPNGPVPGGYVSDTAGSSTVTTGATWLNASGSLLASTSQVNDTPLVSASAGTIGDNAIGIVLTDTGDNSVEATPTVEDNSITAAARGNRSDSTIDVQAGGKPVFEGTAVVTNAQSNYSTTGVVPHTIVGTNTDATILVEIDAAATFTNTLTGGASVADNTISSSAAGNESLGTGGVAGNRILLGDTLSFNGLATGPAVTDIDYSASTLTQAVTADLIINSSQGNVGAGNDDASQRLNIEAATTESAIGVELQAVDGASVDVSGNESTATASGNAASSAFEAGETINLFEGTLAVANQQTNLYVDISANNAESLIGAALVEPGLTLPGSGVTVDGNRVAASAYGNQSSQAIDLAASTTTLPADNVTLRGGVSPDGNIYAEGGATAANLQSVYSSDVAASQGVSAVGIVSGADTVSGSTLEVTNNTQEASAIGSSGATAVALSGTTVAGAVGAVNTQILADDFGVNAIQGESFAGVDINTVVGGSGTSTIAVGANRQAATAYGNQVNQAVSVAATTIDTEESGALLQGGTDPETAASDANVLVNANVGVASLQAINGNDFDDEIEQSINASITVDTIGITADGNVSGSTLVVSWTPSPDPLNPAVVPVKNVQEAIAVGNSGTNGLTLTGNDVGTGAGVASVQLADNVAISATSIDSSIGVSALDVDASTVTVSNNVQRVLAYGGTVGNSLTVAASNIVVDEDIDAVASTVSFDPTNADGFVLDGDDAANPIVDAAYGLLNVQTVHAAVNAVLLGSDAVGIDVLDVEDSTLATNGNAIVAAAYGSEARNSATLGSGNLSTDEESSFASVLNLTNVQTLVSNEDYASNVTATASPAASSTGEVVHTLIDGTVTNSSVSTSGNTIQAQAFGNLADNAVAATLNNIDTEDDGFFGSSGSASVEGGVATTDASFSLNNVQSASGTVLAQLRNDSGDPAVSAGVLTEVTGSVIDSTVHSDRNVLSAAATANRADNLIDLSGNELATSSSLVNYQIDPTNISAYIGIEGGIQSVLVPGTGVDAVVETQPFNYTVSKSNSGCSDGTCDNVKVTKTINTTGLTPEQIAAITGNGEGWVAGVGNTLVLVDNQGTQTDVYYANINVSPGATNADVETSPAIPAEYMDVDVPGSGGVTIAVGGGIDDQIDPSTVTVNLNSTLGSVTGNSATNTINVEASHLPDGNDHIATLATTEGFDTLAYGDHSLANVQIVTEDSTLTSTVYGTFAIDMADDDALVVDSTLEVDGNTQSARAVANTAANSITLDVGSTEAGAALTSNQASEAPVIALSDLDMFAPVASSNSTVSISDNTNLAVGVINNVTNTLTVDATNATYVTVPNHAVLDVDLVGADASGFGTHILLNKQAASTSVSANAVTNIYNDDFADTASEGLVSGTAIISGNSTTAEASANRAVNVLNADASASLSASAGLVNTQSSRATVNASATTDAGIVLANTVPTSAINGSTATLGENSTTALARGNAATNALNFSAGSNYGPGNFGVAEVDLDPSLPNSTVTARAGVLNVQYNEGAVQATSTDASYVVALNSVGAPAATGATIGVIGNSVSAAAYGNTANNSITMVALNSAMPTAALGSQQTNVANVTASAQQVTIGVTTGVGGVTGSSLRVSGNSITATAIGNNAVNTIVAN